MSGAGKSLIRTAARAVAASGGPGGAVSTAPSVARVARRSVHESQRALVNPPPPTVAARFSDGLRFAGAHGVDVMDTPGVVMPADSPDAIFYEETDDGRRRHSPLGAQTSLLDTAARVGEALSPASPGTAHMFGGALPVSVLVAAATGDYSPFIVSDRTGRFVGAPSPGALPDVDAGVAAAAPAEGVGDSAGPEAEGEVVMADPTAFSAAIMNVVDNYFPAPAGPTIADIAAADVARESVARSAGISAADANVIAAMATLSMGGGLAGYAISQAMFNKERRRAARERAEQEAEEEVPRGAELGARARRALKSAVIKAQDGHEAYREFFHDFAHRQWEFISSNRLKNIEIGEDVLSIPYSIKDGKHPEEQFAERLHSYWVKNKPKIPAMQFIPNIEACIKIADLKKRIDPAQKPVEFAAEKKRILQEMQLPIIEDMLKRNPDALNLINDLADRINDESLSPEVRSGAKKSLKEILIQIGLDAPHEIDDVVGVVRSKLDAAIKIQARMKGVLGRRAARAERTKRENLARAGQRVYRGWKRRKDLAEKRQAATRIQSIARMRAAKRELESRRAARQGQAATAIQLAVRRRAAKKLLARKRLERQGEVATKIQSIARMRAAKREANSRRASVAATKLQSRARGLLARREFEKKIAAKREADSRQLAAGVIQRAQRSAVARRELAKRKREKAAAETIQRVYRGMRDRRVAKLDGLVAELDSYKRYEVNSVELKEKERLEVKATIIEQILELATQGGYLSAEKLKNYQEELSVYQSRLGSLAEAEERARAQIAEKESRVVELKNRSGIESLREQETLLGEIKNLADSHDIGVERARYEAQLKEVRAAISSEVKRQTVAKEAAKNLVGNTIRTVLDGIRKKEAARERVSKALREYRLLEGDSSERLPKEELEFLEKQNEILAKIITDAVPAGLGDDEIAQYQRKHIALSSQIEEKTAEITSKTEQLNKDFARIRGTSMVDHATYEERVDEILLRERIVDRAISLADQLGEGEKLRVLRTEKAKLEQKKKSEGVRHEIEKKEQELREVNASDLTELEKIARRLSIYSEIRKLKSGRNGLNKLIAQEKERSKQLLKAATNVQSIRRGNLARRKLEEKNKAAINLQRVYRGRLARGAALRKKFIENEFEAISYLAGKIKDQSLPSSERERYEKRYAKLMENIKEEHRAEVEEEAIKKLTKLQDTRREHAAEGEKKERIAVAKREVKSLKKRLKKIPKRATLAEKLGLLEANREIVKQILIKGKEREGVLTSQQLNEQAERLGKISSRMKRLQTQLNVTEKLREKAARARVSVAKLRRERFEQAKREEKARPVLLRLFKKAKLARDAKRAEADRIAKQQELFKKVKSRIETKESDFYKLFDRLVRRSGWTGPCRAEAGGLTENEQEIFATFVSYYDKLTERQKLELNQIRFEGGRTDTGRDIANLADLYLKTAEYSAFHERIAGRDLAIEDQQFKAIEEFLERDDVKQAISDYLLYDVIDHDKYELVVQLNEMVDAYDGSKKALLLEGKVFGKNIGGRISRFLGGRGSSNLGDLLDLYRFEYGVESQQEKREELAAAKIQPLVRGFLARRGLEKRRLEKRNAAATRIQSIARMRAAKKLLERKKAEAEETKRMKAATKLQKLSRRKILRNRLSERIATRKRKVAVVTKLQALQRMRAAKREANSRREATKRIQAGARGFLARRELAKRKREKAAATAIQLAVRRRAAKKLLAEKKREKAAVGTIQRVYRGMRDRRELKKQHAAAARVQSAARRWSARKEYKEERGKITRAQAGARGFLARRELAKRKQEKAAATVMQSAVRRWSARRELAKRKQRQGDAATKLQALQRMHAARQSYNAQRRAEAEATRRRLAAEQARAVEEARRAEEARERARAVEEARRAEEARERARAVEARRRAEVERIRVRKRRSETAEEELENPKRRRLLVREPDRREAEAADRAAERRRSAAERTRVRRRRSETAEENLERAKTRRLLALEKLRREKRRDVLAARRRAAEEERARAAGASTSAPSIPLSSAAGGGSGSATPAAVAQPVQPPTPPAAPSISPSAAPSVPTPAAVAQPVQPPTPSPTGGGSGSAAPATATGASTAAPSIPPSSAAGGGSGSATPAAVAPSVPTPAAPATATGASTAAPSIPPSPAAPATATGASAAAPSVPTPAAVAQPVQPPTPPAAPSVPTPAAPASTAALRAGNAAEAIQRAYRIAVAKRDLARRRAEKREAERKQAADSAVLTPLEGAKQPVVAQPVQPPMPPAAPSVAAPSTPTPPASPPARMPSAAGSGVANSGVSVSGLSAMVATKPAIVTSTDEAVIEGAIYSKIMKEAVEYYKKLDLVQRLEERDKGLFGERELPQEFCSQHDYEMKLKEVLESPLWQPTQNKELNDIVNVRRRKINQVIHEIVNRNSPELKVDGNAETIEFKSGTRITAIVVKGDKVGNLLPSAPEDSRKPEKTITLTLPRVDPQGNEIAGAYDTVEYEYDEKEGAYKISGATILDTVGESKMTRELQEKIHQAVAEKKEHVKSLETKSSISAMQASVSDILTRAHHAGAENYVSPSLPRAPATKGQPRKKPAGKGRPA